MTAWLYEGVFWFELEDGWTATEVEHLVEVVPPEPAGSLHIAVLRRTKHSRLVTDEAIELVVKFAGNLEVSLEPAGENSGSRVVASASFAAKGHHWDVQARVWLGRAFVSSYCQDGSRGDLRESAFKMMGSIQAIGFPCPCCGCFTLDEEPPGTDDICPVCFWHDDAVQSQDASFVGGPNRVSLQQARENFATLGACDERARTHVRPPFVYEKPTGWRAPAH